jgi:hypothetical protein
MNEYRRPEVTPVDDATAVIQGSKFGVGDSLDPEHLIRTDECTED